MPSRKTTKVQLLHLAKNQSKRPIIETSNTSALIEPSTRSAVANRERPNAPNLRRVFNDDLLNETFRRDGAIVVPLLSSSEVADLIDFFHREQKDAALGFHATMFSADVGYRVRVDRMVRAAMLPKLLPYLHAYRAVVGNFVVKEPSRRDSAVPVHQDWTFVDETKMHSLNVWCPLIDTTPENGRLHVSKGSHRLMQVLRGPYFPNPYVSNAKMIAEHYMTELALDAGMAVIYDHALVHASPANRSGALRIAANLALVPDEAQLIHAYLESGTENTPDRTEIFQVEDAFFLQNIIGERPSETGSPVSSHRTVGPRAISLGFVDPIMRIEPEELSRLFECREAA